MSAMPNIMLDAKHESSYDAWHEQAPCRHTRPNPLDALRRRFDALCLAAYRYERFCAGFHDAKVRGVKARRVQVDELWSFIAAKQKNVAAMKNSVGGAGDTWTWTAIEADTKLLVSHFVGARDGECAKWFIEDMASRIANRIQLTSDGLKAYLEAVEGAFGADIDYAMLNKIYGRRRKAQRAAIALPSAFAAGKRKSKEALT